LTLDRLPRKSESRRRPSISSELTGSHQFSNLKLKASASDDACGEALQPRQTLISGSAGVKGASKSESGNISKQPKHLRDSAVFPYPNRALK
jgi:hypothetical protein